MNRNQFQILLKLLYLKFVCVNVQMALWQRDRPSRGRPVFESPPVHTFF